MVRNVSIGILNGQYDFSISHKKYSTLLKDLYSLTEKFDMKDGKKYIESYCTVGKSQDGNVMSLDKELHERIIETLLGYSNYMFKVDKKKNKPYEAMLTDPKIYLPEPVEGIELELADEQQVIYQLEGEGFKTLTERRVNLLLERTMKRFWFANKAMINNLENRLATEISYLQVAWHLQTAAAEFSKAEFGALNTRIYHADSKIPQLEKTK